MRLRGLPGALALGLLASLLAHLASYGVSHVEGGAFHAALYGLAALALGAFAASAAVLACLGSRRCLQGSILAAKLGVLVPGRGLLAGVSIGWFALGESLEPAHAGVSLLITAGAILATVLLVRSLALALLRVVAAIAIAIRTDAFAPHLAIWTRRIHRRALPCDARIVRRRFARPPPGVMLPLLRFAH